MSNKIQQNQPRIHQNPPICHQALTAAGTSMADHAMQQQIIKHQTAAAAMAGARYLRRNRYGGFLKWGYPNMEGL